MALIHPATRNPGKFADPDVTADGKARASVPIRALQTLWFNTGTLCNLTCANCYIESSPSNDRLAYLERGDVTAYLDQIEALRLPTKEIGFTGGEPFMNPEIIAMLERALSRGHHVLVLSNAMRPMRRHEAAILALNARYPAKFTIRVSIDHHTQEVHDQERGPRSWDRAIDGLLWLAENGVPLAVAGRLLPGESEGTSRQGYASLFGQLGISLDAQDPSALVIFPEMDATADVAEISEGCWDVLGLTPAAVMCSSSRMVVRRKGQPAAEVAACTLLPYDEQFMLGGSLTEARKTVALNHPHCARFCVLGGASCSR